MLNVNRTDCCGGQSGNIACTYQTISPTGTKVSNRSAAPGIVTSGR
ncbi:MAG: hypothetical protein ACYC7A_21665 [Thermoanaerobaculia bacterium]